MLKTINNSLNTQQTLYNQRPVIKKTPLMQQDKVIISNKQTLKQTPISFTGITKSLKTRLYKKLEEIQNIVKRHDNCIAGELPDEWKAKIPQNKIKDIRKDIHTDFALAANDLLEPLKGVKLDNYNYDISIDYDDEYNETFIRLYGKQGLFKFQMDDSIDLAGYTLNSVLKRNGIIKNNENIDFKILGVGKNAVTYSFNVDDKSYVFKVYHEFYKELQDNPSIKSEIEIDTHGILPEANRAFFLNDYAKDNNYAKPIWADLKANYMITMLLDPDYLTEPKKVISKKEVGITTTDNVNSNFIRESQRAYKNRMLTPHNNNQSKANPIEYTIDYGGIEIKNELLATNKSARYVHNKIIRSSSENNWNNTWDDLFKQAKSNKIPNSKDIMLGLTDFLQYLPEKEVPKRLQIMLACARKDANIDKILTFTMLNILCDPESKFSNAQRTSMMNQLEYGATDRLKECLIDNFELFNKAGVGLNLYKMVSVIPTTKATIKLESHIKDLKPEEQSLASKMIAKMKQTLRI